MKITILLAFFGMSFAADSFFERTTQARSSAQLKEQLSEWNAVAKLREDCRMQVQLSQLPFACVKRWNLLFRAGKIKKNQLNRKVKELEEYCTTEVRVSLMLPKGVDLGVLPKSCIRVAEKAIREIRYKMGDVN